MAADDNGARDLESILTEQSESEVGTELDFDRFMQGVIKEGKAPKAAVPEEESPQLRYNKLYRERAANRIRFSR